VKHATVELKVLGIDAEAREVGAKRLESRDGGTGVAGVRRRDRETVGEHCTVAIEFQQQRISELLAPLGALVRCARLPEALPLAWRLCSERCWSVANRRAHESRKREDHLALEHGGERVARSALSREVGLVDNRVDAKRNNHLRQGLAFDSALPKQELARCRQGVPAEIQRQAACSAKRDGDAVAPGFAKTRHKDAPVRHGRDDRVAQGGVREAKGLDRASEVTDQEGGLHTEAVPLDLAAERIGRADLDAAREVGTAGSAGLIAWMVRWRASKTPVRTDAHGSPEQQDSMNMHSSRG
jgi:hypothetical protein